MVSDILEAIGLVLLTVAAWCWHPIVGMVAAGLSFIIAGLAMSGRSVERLPIFGWAEQESDS